MLRVRSLHTSYGPVKALRGIDLDVGRGEIVCLIGSNGSGKTTTLLTISGILRPRSGDISFNDAPLSGMAAHEIVRKGICQVPEGRRVFPRLTVFENLEMGAFSLEGAEIAGNLDRVFALFPILKERRNQLAGTLSGGEQQMCAIARAMVSQPRVLLLDEPSLGLAPVIVERIFEVVQKINGNGVTVLLVEQNAHIALQIAHRGYVIETGRMVLEGVSSELLQNDYVKKAYLGI